MMLAWLAPLLVILLGSVPSVRSQSERNGAFVKAYRYGHNDRDLTEFNMTNVDLVLRCESPINPTEWVYDDDQFNITSPKFPCRKITWNYRWSTTGEYYYQHMVRLYCDKFESDLSMGCRSVNNHSDNVLVKLQPNETTGLVDITKQRGAWLEYEEPYKGSSDCVKFTVVHVGATIHWSCKGPDGRSGDPLVWYCGSPLNCANMQRKLKLMPVCVEYHPNSTNQQTIVGQDWRVMDKDIVIKYPAGVATCKLDNGKWRGASIDYMFAGRDRSTLHFSLSEVSMNDFIWFEEAPPTAVFYTKDTFETSCKASSYGLGLYHRITVNVNGSLLPGKDVEIPKYVSEDLTTVQKLSIDFDGEGFGPGSYEIECSALVWNTSEKVSKTLKFEVRAVMPPYFNVDHENVMLREGDANVRLKCDAHGDPRPNITWVHAVLPGLVIEGEELVLATASAQWFNGSTVACTALNKYGQGATKKLRIMVKLDEADSEVPFPTWTIIGIAVLVVVLLALGLGLGFLTFRFVRFGRAVAQVLSDEEVNDFQQGRPASVTTGTEGDQLVVDCLPYNSEFEVAKENISVDFNTELGSGQYGVVYMGHIKLAKEGGTSQVAVKTVRPNVPVEYFKALVSELKILAYIGHNQHIARLVGAYSSNIKQRELFVAVEFCKTSLLQHLRKKADGFTAETCLRGDGNDYGNVDRPITTLDLIRWSGEIAAGMEFLSDKRVVHGDLAARNVLLSFEMHAKICDFGLARQLVDYTYIKATKCNLPWKWMAIESLRQMHFSTMSDVWAYGVTCWEIFSLGDVPYPCMAWSWDFVNGLVAGNRLDKPTHASPEIFSMLLQCWFERRERRPLFSELRRFFQEQERQLADPSAYVNTDELHSA